MTTGNKLDGSKRKRNIFFCIIAGTIAHIIFILLFVLLILRIRNPVVRLGSVSVETANLNSSSSSASPSFNLKLVAQVTVKNNNFGQFKFHNSTATISYRDTEVGEATIVRARAKARSTKKLNITVSVNSDKVSKNSHLGSDISSKNLTFTAYAKLEGKVHLFLIYKRKIKSAQMNCTFIVNTATKGISNLSCM